MPFLRVIVSLASVIASLRHCLPLVLSNPNSMCRSVPLGISNLVLLDGALALEMWSSVGRIFSRPKVGLVETNVRRMLSPCANRINSNREILRWSNILGC